MWANIEVADFLDWLREHNDGRAPSARVGFYGLDVYSVWDSLERTMAWLGEREPAALPLAARAWRCFAPFDEDPHLYAWNTRLVPISCEDDVVELLVEVRRHAAAGRMGGRYDALMWFETTRALRPLHHETTPEEAEYETEPSGF